MDQFSLSRPAPGYLRATFQNPPINLLDADSLGELVEIIDRLESDDVRVLVLDSADPEYFMARYNAAAPLPEGRSPWAQLDDFAEATRRLEASSTISIASIRGRARGGGSEIALACDLRFASIEKGILGQPEVPFGVLPAGGGIERLTALVGRARAIEIITAGEDFDAATAERYGWINRAVPDDQLDDFVDRLAHRIIAFDKGAVTQAKQLISRDTTVDPADQQETIAAIPLLAAAASPSRRSTIRQRAQAAGADFELQLADYLGP
jgi:enoyl-CoA hydratase/carnithine racemase